MLNDNIYRQANLSISYLSKVSSLNFEPIKPMDDIEIVQMKVEPLLSIIKDETWQS